MSFTTLLAACNKGMVWGQERLPRERGGEGREEGERKRGREREREGEREREKKREREREREGERAREREGGEVVALRAPKIKSKINEEVVTPRVSVKVKH